MDIDYSINDAGFGIRVINKKYLCLGYARQNSCCSYSS